MSADTLADRVSEALFALPGDRLKEALDRLPSGMLWHACFPGMAPELWMDTLGREAEETMRQVSLSWSGADGNLLGASTGLPFAIKTDGDQSPLGTALLKDAIALISLGEDGQLESASSGERNWEIEVVHRDRDEWLRRAFACLDYAAEEALDGRMPDPIEGLIRSPEFDLSGLVPFANADVRLRFVEALWDAERKEAGIDVFRRSHFRRGAAAGLVSAVQQALSHLPSGLIGRDPPVGLSGGPLGAATPPPSWRAFLSPSFPRRPRSRPSRYRSAPGELFCPRSFA